PATVMPAKIGPAFSKNTSESARALRQRFERLKLKKRGLSKLSPQSGLSAQHARGWRGANVLAKAGAPMLFGIRAVSVGRHRQPSAPFSISTLRIGSYSRVTAVAVLLRYACVFPKKAGFAPKP